MSDTVYYVECLIETDGQWENYHIESFILGVFLDLKDAEETVKNIDVERLIRYPYDFAELINDKIVTNPDGDDPIRTIEACDGMLTWTYTIDITEVSTNTIYYRL